LPVLFADVSYYQPVVNDSYPHRVLSIRANDGTYRDPKFAANFAWAQRAMAQGRLEFLIVYCVWRPNWEQTAATMMDMVGTPPHPKVVAMIDVESWGGQIRGNQSDGINRLYWRLADWLGDRRRVIGYGNRGDLNSLWPQRPDDVRLVVAAYGGPPPKFPGMIAHQYGSDVACGPFGTCDMNAANDHDDPAELAAVLGVGAGVQSPNKRRNRAMTYRIDPSFVSPGATTDAVPNGTWPPDEHTISTPGPAGGWAGRIIEHITFGWLGAFIQEAWSAPSGKHYVERWDPNKKTGGVYVEAFKTKSWELPPGDTALIIRVSTRAYGDVTTECEH
jgi:hypothetical protein